MRINFIKNRAKWFAISVGFITMSICGLVFNGLNFGIDFKGGNLIQMHYEENVTLHDINEALDKLVDIPQMSSTGRKVQMSDDNTVIIRSQELTEDQKNTVLETLDAVGKGTVEKSENVGASVGNELKITSLQALGIGAVLIIIYITIRYEFIFAIAAIMALLHDIIIAIGTIAWLQYEVDAPFIAAILTILGYSINDTIVIFDRIRENLRNRRRKKLDIVTTLDNSVNECVTRSINTSLTTLFAVLAVLVFGGASLRTFITAMLVGVVIGTYSSVFLATPIMYIMSGHGKALEKFDREEKEEVEDKILV